jgi:AcrR family transcriptional regulator
MAARLTQSERRERTRSALVAAARQLFAEHGFAESSRDEIAERAGVTRGALYHYFDSKTDLAAAVVEAIDAELVDRVVTGARRGTDAVDQLRLGCRAYVDACASPDIARILLEAPAILGPQTLRAMSDASCVRLLEVALGQGISVPGNTTVAAHLVMGMLNEAASLVAAEPQARRQVRATVDSFLTSLFA